MSADLVLVKLASAKAMLAEAKTIQDTKKIADIAHAAETYAKRQKLSQESIDFAHDIKIEALAQLGRMLMEAPKNTGAAGIGPIAVPESYRNGKPPTLADLGLDRKTSSIAQKLASLPVEQFRAVKAGAASITQAIRQVIQARHPEVALPTDKYRVIYADPPWSYGNTQPDYHTEQRDHYPVMSLSDICAVPVREFAADNAVLFLWVTSPILEESFQVVRAWGFNYKSSFVWDKVKHNMGHYNSVRHEFLLICTRGACTPDVPKLFDSVVTQERGAHTSKQRSPRATPAICYMPFGMSRRRAAASRASPKERDSTARRSTARFRSTGIRNSRALPRFSTPRDCG